MKKTVLITGGILLLCIVLVGRLLFVHRSTMLDERAWFVKAVAYEFSARVDSVKMLNQNTGRLWCSVTSGHPQSQREDSLKRHFKKHDMLYLLFRQSGDSVVFVLPEQAKHVLKGDSVAISSAQNSIQFFREGKPVYSGQLTETLTGFSRPSFAKEK